MANQSPFWEQEKAGGAVFAERFGVELPEHFGDPAVEDVVAEAAAAGLADVLPWHQPRVLAPGHQAPHLL